MPQSLSIVYIHLVFSTKERRPFLRDKGVRASLHAYLGGVSKPLGCTPIIVGGVEDHVHVLCRFGRTVTQADWVKELKRVSNVWLKQQGPEYSDFQWQGGYAAFSVSHSNLEQVSGYVANPWALGRNPVGVGSSGWKDAVAAHFVMDFNAEIEFSFAEMPAPQAQTLEAAIRDHREEIIRLLTHEPPMKAALSLEREGWSREWACKAVEIVETKYNPTNLTDGPLRNQARREKLQTQANIGAGVLLIGLLISVVTLVSALSSGGIVTVAYGAVIGGAGMWLKAFPLIKNHPDRRIPIYMPPKDSRSHTPKDY